MLIDAFPAKNLTSDGKSLLTQSSGGKWAHAAREGRLFMASETAAGVVLPIYSATAAKFVLWNPSGSNVNLSLVRITATYVDTTGAAGGYALGIMKNAGSALATGGISAFTETAPERAPYGGVTGGNKVRFSLAATIIAPTLLYQLGQNQLVLTAADQTVTQWQFRHDFDGELQVAPNNAIVLGGNISTLSKWAASVIWTEEPI